MKKIKVCLLVFINFIFLARIFCSELKDFTEELKDQSLAAEEIFQELNKFNDFKEVTKGDFSLLKNVINDSVTSHSQLWVPIQYDAKKSNPMIIFLHGGISQKDFVSEEELLEYAQECIIWNRLKDENYIFLFPTGKMGYTWWEKEGMKNIQKQIRMLKQKYNIDDNRIFLTGISDGGSGTFHFALNQPDDFASFLPMIGMLGVGSIVNQEPVFVSNLQNSEIYATNTDKDGLYPAAQMRKIVEMIQSVGAKILYKEFWNLGHEVSFLKEEVKFQINFIESQVRNPFSSNLYWETFDLDYGKCDWLEITEIDTIKTKKDWHKFYNTTLLNKRILFGFQNDRDWKKEGVKVTEVIENSAAEKAGLHIEDIIISFDDQEIKDIEKLIELRDTTKKNGEKFTLTVKRKAEEIILKGQFPEPEEFKAVVEGKHSGAVRARYLGNKYMIDTSCVKSLNVYLHPQMVNFENPVVVEHNGKEIFNEKVEFDRNFILGNFKDNFDRKALWVNKIDLKIDE